MLFPFFKVLTYAYRGAGYALYDIDKKYEPETSGPVKP